MPLRKSQAWGIVKKRGFRDKRGRRIRNAGAYVNGMVKASYRRRRWR